MTTLDDAMPIAATAVLTITTVVAAVALAPTETSVPMEIPSAAEVNLRDHQAKVVWERGGGLAPSVASLAARADVSATALEGANRVVLIAQKLNIAADRVAVSADGSVGVTFFGVNRYAMLEVDEDGQIVALLSDRLVENEDPEVWEVDPDLSSAIAAALQRAATFTRPGGTLG